MRDRLQDLEAESVHCVVTSPPYWGLRDYGHAGQIGLEDTPDAFVAALVGVFQEVRRVLRDDGTCWLNLGDSYVASACGVKEGGVSRSSGLHGANLSETYRATLAAGHGHAVDKTGFGLRAKNLVGIPWRVAFALQADGWYLRQDIIWAKPNPMPESVRDRCTKAHEYIFLLAKSERYYYDQDAIMEPAVKAGLLRPFNSEKKSARNVDGKPGTGNEHPDAPLWEVPEDRNKRSVWTVTTQPFKEAHFATFPPALIEPCILAGCPVGGTVLDPFGGAGTTGLVADRMGRNAILIELNPEYAAMAERRIRGDAPLFAEVS